MEGSFEGADPSKSIRVLAAQIFVAVDGVVLGGIGVYLTVHDYQAQGSA